MTESTTTNSTTDTLSVSRKSMEYLEELLAGKAGQIDTSYSPLTPESFQKVKSEEYCVIEIPLLSPEATAQLEKELLGIDWKRYKRIGEDEIPLLGPNLWDNYAYPRGYIIEALHSNAVLDHYAPSRKAAISILKAMLQEAHGSKVDLVYIEELEGYGFTGQGKHFVYSPPHTDFVHRDAPETFPFPKVKSQIAMNLYLSDIHEEDKGECLVFNRKFNPEDDEFLLPPSVSSYGYKGEMFVDTPFKVVRPKRGYVYLFNAQYYHCVLPCKKRRFTLSFFLGELEDGKLVMWS